MNNYLLKIINMIKQFIMNEYKNLTEIDNENIVQFFNSC